MLKLVLFDLDGTLLPMDQDVFIKTYFGALAKKMALKGYDPEKFIKSIWTSVLAMIKNDGSSTNEKVFWKVFSEIYGEEVIKEEPYLEEFYKNEFQNVKSVCGFNPEADKTVKKIKEKGLLLGLATNPVFPAIATESRVSWAGLSKSDFELITTYENSSFCKPNLSYYTEIFSSLGVKAEEVLMVGNDVSEDMVAEKLGAKVFLLTDCLINKNNADISLFPHGSFSGLLEYINSIT